MSSSEPMAKANEQNDDLFARNTDGCISLGERKIELCKQTDLGMSKSVAGSHVESAFSNPKHPPASLSTLQTVTIQLFVEGAHPAGKRYIIEVGQHASIEDAKVAIEAKTGVPAAVQCLKHGAHRLDQGVKLLSYGIREGATLYLISNGPGGGCGASTMQTTQPSPTSSHSSATVMAPDCFPQDLTRVAAADSE